MDAQQTSTTSPDVLAEIYHVQHYSADLLRALLTSDTDYVDKDIARIRLSLAALESKLSVLRNRSGAWREVRKA